MPSAILPQHLLQLKSELKRTVDEPVLRISTANTIDRLRLNAARTEDVIFVTGESRSGTTWVGKIMDSHPDVIYRHEPDFAIYEPALPFIIPDKDIDRHIDLARALFARLLTNPTLKSAGPPPFFPKNHHAPGVRALRAGLITGLAGIRSVSNWRDLNRLYVPDMVRPSARSKSRFVLKSIATAGRAAVLKRAFPKARFILLLRHPCGHVRSVLEGRRAGRTEPRNLARFAAELPNAKHYGLTMERLHSMSDLELHTWIWCLRNEMALRTLDESEHCRVVHYESVCENPFKAARELFAFGGLTWHAQTERFLQQSSEHKGTEGYYRVYRNASAAANKWRSALSEREKRSILGIVAQTSLASLWPETGQAGCKMPAQASIDQIRREI